MSWDKSDNGDTSRMCYYWILEEVENHLKKVIYSKEDRWFNILDYDVRSRKRDVDNSVYRLIHNKGKSILATLVTFDPLNDVAI